ncbi:hypothetical protein ES702_00762 [subsurface metagenome]
MFIAPFCVLGEAVSKQSEAENEQTSVRVEIDLLEDIRIAFPAAKKMTFKGLVDFGLRKLLEMKKDG